jgi:hypothetical protein
MKTLEIKFKEPKVLGKSIKNGKLELTLDWFQSGISQTIITKTPSGYNYEDVGFMKRNFTDLESMMWEFELPNFLKKDIENLLIIDEDKNQIELTKSGLIELKKQTEFISQLLSQEPQRNGSKYTPKKKKNRKK